MLEVKLLGQFEILMDGEHVTIPTRNAQSLLAYLMLYPGRTHRREKLAGLLWPDSSEENARSNLRHELWRLRKALDKDAESFFTIDDLTIAFNPHSTYNLDVHKFESASLEGGSTEELTSALSAYHGELLPGFYDEWVTVERERLRALFEAKISRLLEILQFEGRWPEVLEWAMHWISSDEWPEPAYRALMTAYASTGDISKSVATYERFTKGIQKDLGIKPSEQTQAVYKRLKAGWKTEAEKIAFTRDVQPPKTSPEIVSSLFPLPRLRSSNLPRPLTSFVGREKETQQVEHLVSIGRLVTITGSGGVGKTRLAIQVASSLTPQFIDGTWWVELASLSDHGGSAGAELVHQAVAKAMRIPENPGVSILEGIVEYVSDKQILLILDNCEHLIDDCSALAERLLNDCPKLTILGTSREALGVPGEKAWLLPSLSLPERGRSSDVRDIFQSEAVDLFIERAADVLPGYKPDEGDASTIAQICLRLDGIPLAIELAAARMNLLSAQEIATRLDGRFSLLTGGHRTALPRHQTLRGAIEWSFDLLSKPEQMLFRRLSVFAGSFTLTAAEATATGQGIHQDEVLTLLGRLVDKSLLNVEPVPQDTNLATRYRFLDTIRSYGRLKLDEAEETRWMRDRHAAYYVHLVESVEPAELLLQNQIGLNRLLQIEHDNLRAVVDWGTESDHAENALRLVSALFWYWWRSSSTREGRDLALKALTTPSAILFPEARARALNTVGYLQCLLGDTTSARRSLEEARSILRTVGDEVNLALSYQFLGLALAYDKEYDLADKAFKEGLTIAKKLKLKEKHADIILFFRGDVDYLRGDVLRAKQLYEESVNILRGIGNNSFLAYPLRRLGYLALEQEDFSDAKNYFRESLRLNYEINDLPGVTASLTSLAALAIRLGKPIVAARLYGGVVSRLESLSVNLLFTDQAELGRIASQLPAFLDDSTFNAAISEGWEMNEAQAVQLAEQILADSGQ